MPATYSETQRLEVGVIIDNSVYFATIAVDTSGVEERLFLHSRDNPEIKKPFIFSFFLNSQTAVIGVPTAGKKLPILIIKDISREIQQDHREGITFACRLP